MAAFSTDALTQHPADFGLARSGGVAVFLSRSVLASTQSELAGLGYQLKGADASAWDEETLLRDLGSLLAFPEYYGHNWAALADCLGDVAAGEYGWDPASTGLAVTMSGFGSFARRDSGLAHQLVEYFIATSRAALLFGHRLLWLLHVDDRNFRLEPLGSVSVPWNGREWLDANRE